MQGVHLRKYGGQTTVDFELYEIDGVDMRVDAVHAAGDSKIMKNEGAEANTTNGFVDEGQGYSLVLTATEMQAARVVVYFVDQTATKAWLDKCVVVETYGHASAMHALDLDDAVRGGMTALPNAAADAAGGLPISDAGGLDIDAKLANTNEVTAARMGALTDWINGGRLDLLLDAVKGKTDNLPGSPAATGDAMNLAADAVDAAALAADALEEIADAIWDEILTGGTHNIPTSAGRRLRQLEAGLIIHSGTAQAGSTSTTFNLDAGASAVEEFYRHDLIVIVAGTGAGQARQIHEYDGGTKVATLLAASAWVVTPDNTSEFEILANDALHVSHIHENGVDADAVSAGAVTKIQSGLALASVLGASVGADISADIAAVKAATDAIPTTPMRGTDGASTFDAGADEVDVGAVKGTSLQAKVGPNLDAFYQNSGVDTSKEVDDVGGGSGVTDWSAGERSNIRQALGVEGAKAATANGNLDAVQAKTVNLPASPAATGDEMGLTPLTLTEIAEEIRDSKWTAGGTATVGFLMRCINAMAKGNFYRDGNVYTFYDDDDTGSEDGTLLYTLTVSVNGERINS